MITVLTICLVILMNLLFDNLSNRFGWKKDLTIDGRYAVSSEMREFLSDIKQDVTIIVLKDESSLEEGDSYSVSVYQILKKSVLLNPHLKLRFVNLTDNPTFSSKYPDLKLSDWDILVESADRTEVVPFQELFLFSEDRSSIIGSQAEQKLATAIAQVTAVNKIKVMNLTGFSEDASASLKELLKANQFEVEDVSLLTENLDDSAEAAILFAPERDPEPELLQKLALWLDHNGSQGRNLFVFLDPNRPNLSNLMAFLHQWGIGAETGFAFESNPTLYYERFYYPIAQYANMDYAEGMNASDLTVMALCQPVSTLFDSANGYKTDTLLQFTSSSGVAQLGAQQITDSDITGDVRAMVMSTHSYYGSEVTESHVVLSGSAMAFSETLLNSTSFANAKYISGLFRKLCKSSENTMAIVPKNYSSQINNMTAVQANISVWVFMVIAPAMILMIGVIVWLRRRHR